LGFAPLGEDCENIQAFEEISFDWIGDSVVSTAYKLPDNVPALMDTIESQDFKAELLENINQTEFAKRSNLVHWFYYKLTQEVVKN
jgi:hypothetical protein